MAIPFPLGFATGDGVPSHAEMDAYLLAGAEFIRSGVHWNTLDTNMDGVIETTTPLDNMLSYAASIGLPVIVVASRTTDASVEMSDPAIQPFYAKYVANLAAHLNGNQTVMAIEVGNEPDTGPWSQDKAPYNGYRGQSYGAMFIRLMGPGSQGFEHAGTRTDRPIIIGAPARSDPLTHYQEMHGWRDVGTPSETHPGITVDGHAYPDGVLGLYDGVGFHPYDNGGFASTSLTDLDGTGGMIDTMEWFSSEYSIVPEMWITEYGYPTYKVADGTIDTPDLYSKQQQSLTDMADTYTTLLASRGWTLHAFSWFEFMDKLTPAWVSGHSYSVHDNVSVAGVNYECIAATSGTTSPPSDSTHWVLSEANDYHWGVVHDAGTFPVPNSAKKPAYSTFRSLTAGQSSTGGFKVGLAVGAGLPDTTEIDFYQDALAQFLRGSVTWSSMDLSLTGTLPVDSSGTPLPGGEGNALGALDAYVQDLNNRNIDVILQISGGSAGGSMNSHINNYSSFVIAIIDRYKVSSQWGEVQVLEVGNEPNFAHWDANNVSIAGGGIGPNAAAAIYAHLMSLVYAGAQLIGPKTQRARVMIGGIAGAVATTPDKGIGMADWVNGLYAANPSIKGNYDIFCTHRYCFPYTPTQALAGATDRGWASATIGTGAPLTGAQQIRNANNDGTLPHAVTEFGVPSPDPATISPKGNWSSAGVAYAINDSVQDASVTYLCIAAHTSSSSNEPGTGGGAADWIVSPQGFSSAQWTEMMVSAIVEYYKEPTACYFAVFTGFDHPATDQGLLYGIGSYNAAGTVINPKPVIFQEYQRLTTWRPSSGLIVNRPSDWSSNDLGWSIPGQDIPSNQAGMDRVLERIVSSGSKLLITDFVWSDFQPGNPNNKTAGNNDNGALAGNVFGSTKHDLLMDRCQNFGISVIAGCQYTPGWANGGAGNDKVPPSRDKVHYSDYALFVQKVCDRYQTRNPNVLIAISVWNEPNISTFWQDPDNSNGPYVVNYAKMLIAAYDAVHSGVVHAQGGDRNLTAHPEIMVGNGGMAVASGNGSNGHSYGWPEWVNGLIAGGATNSFDVFFVHPYMWLCDATRTNFGWNPMNYIQPCYAAFKAAGRNDIYAWATEMGMGTRANDSGTDAANTFDCSTGHNGPNGVGGYASGAPTGSYNTNNQCITYAQAVSRCSAYTAEWRGADFFDADPNVNRLWSGPMFWWSMNDEAANDTTWNGSFNGGGSKNSDWQAHAGAFFHGSGDGTQGKIKPFAQAFLDSFSDTGYPGKSGVNDTKKPKTYIASINGIDVTTPTTGFGVPLFIANGAAKPTTTDMDEMVAVGAAGIRMSLNWDSANPSHDGVTLATTYMNSIKALVQYANGLTLLSGVTPARGSPGGLAVDLQIALGATFGDAGSTGIGLGYNERAFPDGTPGVDTGGDAVNVPKKFAEFAATIVTYFKHSNGNGKVWSFELGNEPNHQKYDDPSTGSGIPAAPATMQGPCKGRSYLKCFAYFSRLAKAADSTCRITIGGLGGQSDKDGRPSDEFTQDMYDAIVPSGESYDGVAIPNGIHGLFDQFNAHPYCYPLPPLLDLAKGTHGRGWANMVLSILPILVAGRRRDGTLAGSDANVPVLITEFGDPNPPDPIGNADGSYLNPPAANGSVGSTAALLDALKDWSIRPQGGMIQAPLTWFQFQDDLKKGRGFGLVNTAWTGVAPHSTADRKQPLWQIFHDIATGVVGGGGTAVPVVSGDNVPIAIYANDPAPSSGIQRVDVIVDGTTIGQATLGQFGYGFSMDTTVAGQPQSTNGPHQIQSKATDFAGNSKLSIAVDFTTQNGQPGLPNVTQVVSDDGTNVPTAGGGAIAIGGDNFVVGGVMPTVEIGKAGGPWTACTGVTGVNTLLACTTPAHSPAETVHVRVTTTAGPSALRASDKITYQDAQIPGAPVVFNLSQNTGPLAGGETILVNGSGFTNPDASDVLFDTTHATSFQIISDAVISVVVPALAAGPYDVTVVNSNGPSQIVAGDVFTSQDSPTVSETGVANGDLVTGTVAVLVHATDTSDPNPLVKLIVSGNIAPFLPIRTDSAGNPDPTGDYYQFAFNSNAKANDGSPLYPNGTYNFKARATNADGLVGESTAVTIAINNAQTSDTTPPTMQILAPSTGALISGMAVPFSISGVDNVDAIVPVVELWITQSVTNPPPSGGSFEMGISFLGGPDQLGGNSIIDQENGQEGQQGQLPDTTVVPIKRVGIGIRNGNDTTFLALWNTLSDPNGVYQIQARGLDAAGNEGWSDPISIQVNNVFVPPTHPTAQDLRYPWRVFVRDGATLRRTAQVQRFHSLDFTLKLNDVGVFTLIVPATDPSVPFLQADVAGILVYYKNQIVFSGDVSVRVRSRDAADMWEFDGEDDNAFIRDTLLSASPTEEYPTAGKFAHTTDARSGPAESLILAYIAANRGPQITLASGTVVPAAAGTRHDPLISMATDQGRGSGLSVNPGWAQLLPVLQQVAAASSPALGFRIIQTQTSSPSLQAQVYVPIDKARFVRFATQLGNLLSFSYQEVAPTADVVYAGGSGDGVNRQFIVLEDGTAISRWRRRETFTDHTDAANLIDLGYAALGDIVQSVPPPSISLEPRDINNARFVDDYFLGDKVTFLLPEGDTFADVVVSVAVRLDDTGVLVQPAVGAGPQDALAVFAETRRLAAAVRTLQTTRTVS